MSSPRAKRTPLLNHPVSSSTFSSSPLAPVQSISPTLSGSNHTSAPRSARVVIAHGNLGRWSLRILAQLMVQMGQPSQQGQRATTRTGSLLSIYSALKLGESRVARPGQKAEALLPPRSKADCSSPAVCLGLGPGHERARNRKHIVAEALHERI